MGKRPFYRKVRRTLYETVSDSGNSVLRYRGHDDKEYYVASSDDPNIGPGGGMIEVTWQELKNKRDAGELIPGCLYRITDYQCTTTQENTQSAGHQFDIVLLALSENKLAEEGWAMHHADDTYFANSNLSAWKVWYCLDNDTTRFAWADDSVDEGTPAFITNNGVNYYRDVLHDSEGSTFPYAWTSSENVTKYTNVLEPSGQPGLAGYIAFVNNPNETPPISSANVTYTPAHEGTNLPNGRGVIYRLIDEWGNDVPYDFKNIQFVRKLTDGHINAQGSDTWCYTFNAYFNGDTYDYSIVSAIWKDDEDDVLPVMNNTIYSIKSDNGGSKKLNNFVFNADGAEPDVYGVVIKNNLFLMTGDGGNFEGKALMHSIFLDTINNIIYNDSTNGIIIYRNKKVVFENIT